MPRKTSIDAFRQIKENGLLSEKRWAVYEALYECGPATGMEVLKHIQKKQGYKNTADSQVRARLNELQKLGIVEELGEKVCTVTGQTVILWDILEGLPGVIKKVEKSWWVLFPMDIEAHKPKLFRDFNQMLEFRRKGDYRNYYEVEEM